MKRLIAIITLGLAISFTSLKSGVTIDREGIQLTTFSPPILICPLPRAVILRQISQGINSSAFDYMDLYTKPIVKSEVKNEIKSGNVEKDLMSFYINSKEVKTETSLRAGHKIDDNGDYIIIFGVRIAPSSGG